MSERRPNERAEAPVDHSIQLRYEHLSPHLDERGCRLFAAAEATPTVKANSLRYSSIPKLLNCGVPVFSSLKTAVSFVIDFRLTVV